MLPVPFNNNRKSPLNKASVPYAMDPMPLPMLAGNRSQKPSFLLPSFSSQGLQSPFAAPSPNPRSVQASPFALPYGGKNLQQSTQFGSNYVQSRYANQSINVSQQAQNAQIQEAYFGGVQGNVNISQQGRSQGGNDAIFNNVRGNAYLNSFNTAGDVYVEGNNIDGSVAINTGTNPFALSEIRLKDLRRGGAIKSLGASDIDIENAQDNIMIQAGGVQGQAEVYTIKLNEISSLKANRIQILGQREDAASINLMGNRNGTEVFLQGVVNNIDIEGRNNQKDVFHVEGDAVIDLTKLDPEDTVIIRLADGSIVSKSVVQLQELSLLKMMTPQKATQILRNNFGAFESLLDTDKNRKDNIALFNELVAYTQLPTADSNVKAAAQYFINHRVETFDKMEGLNDGGKKDGLFSLDEMTKFGQILDGTLTVPTPKAELQPQSDAIKTMNGKTAAQILKDNFGVFESLLDPDKNHKDNIASFDELLAYTQLTATDPTVKAAAQYFIDHRAETFDKMEGLNDGGKKDGIFSLDEMTKFIALA